MQIHRVEAGAAVLQLDGVGALRKLNHVEGAADRIRAGVIAQAAHHVLRLRRRFRRVRGRAFRPVQIHARAELDDVKLVRVDLHFKIRIDRFLGKLVQIHRDALELVGVFAVLQLIPLQIEQSVLGVVCIKLRIHAEIDDIARRQQIPGRPEIRIGKTGKLAVLVQRIDVHRLIRPLLRCVGYAHMVSGNAVSVPECAGVEALKPIQTIRFLVDNLAIDISLAVAAGAGADDIDGFRVTSRSRQKDLWHDGVVVLPEHPCVLLIEYDIQSFVRVLLHQHGRQDGFIGRFRRRAGAGAAGEHAAQDRQRAEAAPLIVHPTADIHRKVVVRIRLALGCTSVLATVRIPD